MLGIDEKRFIETFEGYDKKTASRITEGGKKML